MYKCKECGATVIVHEGVVHKICSCKAPIIAGMSAQAKGKGGVKV